MDFLLLAIHHYLPEVSVNFIIDEELRLLIPPLSKEEYKQLEENIRQWGCLDPLKVWAVDDGNEAILLDGHNRYSICSDHNISYVTESISLIDREAAIDWMIDNQLGRRNLSAAQVSYLRGRQQHQEKKKATNPDGYNQHIEVEPQNEAQPLGKTASRLAKQHGVSKATIERDANYAEAVDAIIAATAPEIQQQLLGFDSKFTKSATLKLAELVQEEPGVVMEIIEEVQQAPNKTAASAVVQRSISEIKEIPMNKQTARLIDFEDATDGINWLRRRFTEAEIIESLAKPTTSEEADAWLKQNSINSPLMEEIDRQ
jgi:predicted nucleic acid-binding protein